MEVERVLANRGMEQLSRAQALARVWGVSVLCHSLSESWRAEQVSWGGGCKRTCLHTLKLQQRFALLVLLRSRPFSSSLTSAKCGSG